MRTQLQNSIATVLLLLAQRILARFDIPDDANKDESEVINAHEPWIKNCPHVSDNPPYQKLIVTWTLNGAIWLKVDNGKAIITNRLTSIKSFNISGRPVVSVNLNSNRYGFYHDESTGVFSLTVNPTRRADSGVWQCHVEIFSLNGNVEQRSSTKNLRVIGDTPDGGFFSTPTPTGKWPKKEIIFERDVKKHHDKTIEVEEIGTLENEYRRRSQNGHRSSSTGIFTAVVIVLFRLLEKHLLATNTMGV